MLSIFTLQRYKLEIALTTKLVFNEFIIRNNTLKKEIKSVDEYIKAFPEDVIDKLQCIRQIIKVNAAESLECLSYVMPAYKIEGKPLVYFAAYKNHIGFYAAPTGHEKFKKQLSVYKQGKGPVQFPLDQALPEELIEAIIKFRKTENINK